MWSCNSIKGVSPQATRLWCDLYGVLICSPLPLRKGCYVLLWWFDFWICSNIYLMKVKINRFSFRSINRNCVLILFVPLIYLSTFGYTSEREGKFAFARLFMGIDRRSVSELWHALWCYLKQYITDPRVCVTIWISFVAACMFVLFAEWIDL